MKNRKHTVSGLTRKKKIKNKQFYILHCFFPQFIQNKNNDNLNVKTVNKKVNCQ